MKQVDSISIAELRQMAERMYGDLVKVDVDVSRRAVVVDMEMHADGEAMLLESGSKEADLWGINLYPAKFGTDGFVEFNSMINIKPSQRNMTRGVEDMAIQAQIRAIISGVVHA